MRRMLQKHASIIASSYDVLFHGRSAEWQADALHVEQSVVDRGTVVHAVEVVCALRKCGVCLQPFGEDAAAGGDVHSV
jgi:hypothetical protein